MSSGAGSALAGNSPARNQYIENVPTIHGKHHRGSHKRPTSTGTTKAGGSTTTSTGGVPTVRGTAHHKVKHHKITHHKTKKLGKHKVKHSSVAGRRGHSSSKPTHSTRLTAATATGSSGGISTWLLVVLILVLVGGSAAGILRYRRRAH